MTDPPTKYRLDTLKLFQQHQITSRDPCLIDAVAAFLYHLDKEPTPHEPVQASPRL